MATFWIDNHSPMNFPYELMALDTPILQFTTLNNSGTIRYGQYDRPFNSGMFNGKTLDTLVFELRSILGLQFKAQLLKIRFV